jgi:hypothetical protein
LHVIVFMSDLFRVGDGVRLRRRSAAPAASTG